MRFEAPSVGGYIGYIYIYIHIYVYIYIYVYIHIYIYMAICNPLIFQWTYTPTTPNSSIAHLATSHGDQGAGRFAAPGADGRCKRRGSHDFGINGLT